MAQDLNTVALIGRLAKSAELKYTPKGLAIATFAIAVNRSVKKEDGWKDEASFFECTVFGKQAESLKPYLVKGQQIAINGELKQDRWESDGQTRSKVTVNAENVQLIGGKKDNAHNNGMQQPIQQPYEQRQPYEDDSYQEGIPF